MFNRPKKDDSTPDRPTVTASGETSAGTPALKPFSARGQNAIKQPSASFRPEVPKRTLDIPGSGRSATGVKSTAPVADSKQLIVGQDITLNGEISTCDKLVVEGRVEARLSDGQSMEITQSGFYKGSAKVIEALISGTFEGELEAERCIITETGQVSGKLTYAVVEIQPGGRAVGTMVLLDDTADDTAPAAASQA